MAGGVKGFRFGRQSRILPPREEDVEAAVQFIEESYEAPVDRGRLRLVGAEWMDPWEFVDDSAHLGRKSERGWLLEYPEDAWLQELKGAYSRDFDHILDYWRRGSMPSGIQIDGLMGDGRGRAMFHFAIGEKMPVAVFRSASA